jgi:hypothetical protein
MHFGRTPHFHSPGADSEPGSRHQSANLYQTLSDSVVRDEDLKALFPRTFGHSEATCKISGLICLRLRT